MSEEHDEALLERVARGLYEVARPYATKRCWDDASDGTRECFLAEARSIIYPPKTRLQVARELLAAEFEAGGHHLEAKAVRAGEWDNTPSMKAILAALAHPQMED